MKKSIFIVLTILLMTSSGFSQSSEKQAIKETITAFSAAGDASDAPVVATYLDDNFRIIMNRLFGSQEVQIIPKSVYVEKIGTKEFGGDVRNLSFKNIVINGASASAQVTYAGQKMTFVSITTLLKDATGKWKLVSEIPIIM